MSIFNRISCLAVCLSVTLFGICVQVQAVDRQTIEQARAEIQADRQAFVANNLPLEKEEADKFWPMYREYSLEMAKIGDEIVKQVDWYFDNMATFTNAQAHRMMLESIALQEKKLQLKKDWITRFMEVLPARKVARFYQLENEMDLIVGYELIKEIPLVE